MTTPETSPWLDDAVTAVEACITQLLTDFVQHPYAHRVELSLHMDLYQALRAHAPLGEEIPIGSTPFSTRLVHTEWPSAKATTRIGSDRLRRQSFDLAVIDPDDIRTGELEEFTQGRFRAPIAIELGLDYSLSHVKGDLEKLESNAVNHPYFVHLSRKRTRQAVDVEREILKADGVRTAFAHLDAESGLIRWKGLDDSELREERYVAG